MVGFLKLLVSMSLYGNIFHLIKITETPIWFTVRIVPYEWVPQLENQRRKKLPLDIAAFRVPNAAEAGTESVVTVEGTISYGTGDFCVATLEEINKIRD